MPLLCLKKLWDTMSLENSMDKKYTLMINKIDPVTDKCSTVLEAASTNMYDLKVMAEREIYYKIIHWVWISNIITLVPELHQGTDRTIVVGSVENESNIQITIIG